MRHFKLNKKVQHQIKKISKKNIFLGARVLLTSNSLKKFNKKVRNKKFEEK
jgi:hypothetical protein